MNCICCEKKSNNLLCKPCFLKAMEAEKETMKILNKISKILNKEVN